MKRWNSVLPCTAVLVSFICTSPCRAASVSDFIDFSHPSVPGRLYVPPEASDSTNPRPLILFLHGAGETGTNNVSQINGNINNLLDEAKARGAFLYAPQATTYTWADTTRTSTVMSMIDQALLDYNIDPDRLYVTGLSMGGGGVWNVLNRFDDRIAAGVPIAAVSPGPDFEPSHLVGKPAWAFHARDDATVPSIASRNVVDQILAAASSRAIIHASPVDPLQTFLYSHEEVGINFSEFPRGGHGIWGAVYDTPEMYDWLFAQELMPASPVAPSVSMQLLIDTTDPDFYPIGTPDGIAIAAGTGFAAVGTFSLSDEQISQTNAGSLASLAADFAQFGPGFTVGVRSVEGLLNVNVGAALPAGDDFIGKNIYLVVGDGDDIGDSSSLFIYKSPAQFAADVPLLSFVGGSEPFLGGILLGTPGSVYMNRGGGLRDGVLAADVTVPEPLTLWMTVVAIALLTVKCRCRTVAAADLTPKLGRYQTTRGLGPSSSHRILAVPNIPGRT